MFILMALLWPPGVQASAVNNALSFNGTDQYVDIPDANSLDLTTNYTLETWFEIRPAKNSMTAVIAVPFKDMNAVFPLTVAPKAQLVKKRKATETDFKQFLSSRGRGIQPKGDLNKDGNRDYRDDYIFTVNYILESERIK